MNAFRLNDLIFRSSRQLPLYGLSASTGLCKHCKKTQIDKGTFQCVGLILQKQHL
jgi:hypothetical protein